MSRLIYSKGLILVKLIAQQRFLYFSRCDLQIYRPEKSLSNNYNMSIPLPLQNLSSIKKSPTSKPKPTKQPFANESNNIFYHEISHKLYDLKNIDGKKKIVILDEFAVPPSHDGCSEDIEGAITSRYEPVERLSRDKGLVRCKKMVIGHKKDENNRKMGKNRSPSAKQMKRRPSIQQSTKKR